MNGPASAAYGVSRRNAAANEELPRTLTRRIGPPGGFSGSAVGTSPTFPKRAASAGLQVPPCTTRYRLNFFWGVEEGGRPSTPPEAHRDLRDTRARAGGARAGRLAALQQKWSGPGRSHNLYYGTFPIFVNEIRDLRENSFNATSGVACPMCHKRHRSEAPWPLARGGPKPGPFPLRSRIVRRSFNPPHQARVKPWIDTQISGRPGRVGSNS